MSRIVEYKQITNLPILSHINRNDDLFVYTRQSGNYGFISAENIMTSLPTYLFPELNPIVQNRNIVNRNIYRGKYLGNQITSDQLSTIHDGYFRDMYVGDFWRINGTWYLIADFNYWPDVNEDYGNHIVVIPMLPLYQEQMNTSETTTGGYAGSYMYTNGLDDALTTIQNAFGSSHVPTHRSLISNAMATSSNYITYESSFTVTSVHIELMNDIMVFGHTLFRPQNSDLALTGVNKFGGEGQLALFKLHPEYMNGIGWLRTAITDREFLCVTGNQISASAVSSYGVRPVFAVTN